MAETPVATPPAATPPVRTIAERLDALERDIARGATIVGNPGLATRRTWSDRSGRPTTLVVAGETSRGKSTLLNSLLGTSGLLPVGPDVTTNVYVMLRAGGPRAIVRLEGDQSFEVLLAELPRWTTVSGRRDEDPQAVMVEIEASSPMLERGLVVIDTPGVGGIDSAHAEATMLALELADALLFVLDAHAPISAPERAFLERAADAIDTVIFAVTKIDMFDGWAKVHSQTQEFIAEHLPRFTTAPIVAVSAERMAQAEAIQALNPSFAESMRRDLRIDDLRGEIERRVLEPGEQLRLVNRLRAADSAIARLRAHVEATRSAASGDETATQAVTEMRTRITELQSGSSTWRGKVIDEMTLVRSDLMTRFTGELNGVDEDLGLLTDPRQLRTYPEVLEERLAGALIALNASLGRGVTRIASEIAKALEVDDIELPELESTNPEVVVAPIRDLPNPTDRTTAQNAVGIGRLVTSSLGPVTMATWLGAVSGLFLAPVGFAIGLTMGLVERKAMSEKTSLAAAQRQWSDILKRTLNPMRSEVPAQIDRRLLEARQDLVSRTEAAIKERDKELRNELTRLSDVAKQGQSERAKLEQTAVDNLKGISDLGARAQAIRRDLALATASAAFTATPAPVTPADASPTTPASMDPWRGA